MIIDPLGSLPISQALDIKLEESRETEEARAIEDSEKGNDSTLDNSEQNIANRPADRDITQDVDVEFETYNAQRNLSEEFYSGDSLNHQQAGINLFV